MHPRLVVGRFCIMYEHCCGCGTLKWHWFPVSEVCNDGYSVLVIFSLFYPRCFLGCVKKTFLFMFHLYCRAIRNSLHRAITLNRLKIMNK